MNIKNSFMICCYFIMQSLSASQQVSTVDEQAIALEEQNKVEIRKRDYHINMLNQYTNCLENSQFNEAQQLLCTQEYTSALAYLRREQKKMYDHQK